MHYQLGIMPVHNLSDKTRFGELDSSGMTCCISDRFNRGSNVNTNVKWLRRRAVLNLRRRFFFSLLSFSFTEGVTEDHLPSQLEWGIVGNLSGCEIGRRHCCFDRVSARALYVSVCVSAAGTWGVLLRHLRWRHSVRLITFSKLEEGKRVSVCCPCESTDFYVCVWSCIEAYLRRKQSLFSSLRLCSDKGSSLPTGPLIHANKRTCACK